MTPQELLFDLLSRAFVLSLPISVGALAFRRLLLSRTANVWVYALAVGYASFATLGLVPWAVGLQPVSTAFIVFAAVCPLLWIAIIAVCGAGRGTPYDLDTSAEVEPIPQPILPPLILKNPVIPEPVAVFRHHATAVRLSNTPPRSVLNVARSMRGRTSSEDRRVRKLLPPPRPEATNLPFLR